MQMSVRYLINVDSRVFAICAVVICSVVLSLYYKFQEDLFSYEARSLFRWEMLTKTMISCFLNVQKIWKSAQINLSSIWNFYRRYFFDATMSTEKSTSEIDADLAQNDL